MTCEEFRQRWTDAEWETSDDSTGSAPHLDTCPSCAAWVARQRALDDTLATALLVAPPAELSARLARIPATFARPATESAGQRVLGFAFLVVVALGAIGVSGAALGFVLGLIWPSATDALQAITLILDSPLVGYYQNIASTLLEALATLVLAALVILQMRPAPDPHAG